MGRVMKSISALSVLLALTLIVFGCSKQASGPKDEDAIKAVTAAIESSAKDASLKPAVTILERGKQTPAGEWPIKVDYTLTLKDGSAKKETKTFNLSSSINDMGVPVWMAAEAK